MTAFTLGQASMRAVQGMHARRHDAGRSGGLLCAVPRVRVGGSHCTGALVRRGSMEAGTFEELFFAVPAPGETDRLLRMARRALDAGRQLRREARSGARVLTRSERPLAALTASAIRIYEEICTLARLNHGRVFPTYDHLAAATALGRATVARALHLLEAVGFLVRQRRFKRVEGEGAPRYKQTSNVYRPTLATRVVPYLPRWMKPAPLPDDAVQQGVDHAAAHREMLASLSCRELAAATVGGALGKMLARLGARIDEAEIRTACESQYDPQTPTNSIHTFDKSFT